jgi:ribA/ribD-fused uncharacterized protein
MARSAIVSFHEEHRFLSNFYLRQVQVGQNTFATAEHAFAWHKTLDESWRARIAAADTPGGAKRIGRQVPLREGWDLVKKHVMLVVVTAKFTQHADLAKQLVATEDTVLIEGNTWHDNYWGSCTCGRCGHGDLNYGQNYLGQILMAVRFIVRPD